MEKVCPVCGKPVSDGDKVCANCGHVFDETAVKEAATAPAAEKKTGRAKKTLAWIAAAAVLAGVIYASQQANSSVSARISVPEKANPVSGNQIVNVTKPLYLIKEDDFAYTNIQWATALCPEFGDYIPGDIPSIEPMANNTVKISGSSVTIDLAPLAGITPVVFSDLGDGNVSPSSIPDEEIEIVYGYRDGITLRGTITDYGTTRELDPDTHIHYGRHSGSYDKNVFTNTTVYYINGTINSVQNNIRTDKGFTSGYKETIYNHDGMYVNMKKTHETFYTYPGITQQGKEGIYNSEEELTGYRDVEYQAFSRFQILYFPDQDLFQVDIILLDQGHVYAEGDDGNGRHEEDSAETDNIHRISMLSDYEMFRSVDEWYEYMGETYIIVYR